MDEEKVDKARPGRHRALFRFYAELNDFLPTRKRGRDFEATFDGAPAIKDTIEALGAPHTEVALVLANGTPVGLDYRLQDRDRISVYPLFRLFDVDPEKRPRFVLDVHLGRLAAYLRMCGFDARYRNDYDDETLVSIADTEGRILLTRDRGLLKRSRVRRGYCVRASEPRRQIVDVLRRYRLKDEIRPFGRCMACNGELEAVEEADLVESPPRAALQAGGELRRCRACGRLYWKGTHVERMRRLLDSIEEELTTGAL